MSPMVYALCPTYGRPELLKNSIACFLAQEYPASCSRLLICDDGGQIPTQSHRNVAVVSRAERFSTITLKYNWMAQRAIRDGAEILVVWEDDDVYLRHHLSVHSRALQNGRYSKPSRILSTYGRELNQEDSSGRFHASIAFHRDAYLAVDGWSETKQADFDQQLLANLKRTVGEIDTCLYGPPSYVFRWESTEQAHAQFHMESAEDEDWWERCRRDDLKPLPDWQATGKWDRESKWLYEQIALQMPD